jgi:quinolinate synthase
MAGRRDIHNPATPAAAREEQAAIRRLRDALAGRLLLLAHHYVQDEIVALADVVGDSFKLAQAAASRRDAQWIVLCGVRFMAESADILTAPEQSVYMPDPTAGCSMADMASPETAADCWAELASLPGRTVPVTYINSLAEIKALVGSSGGSVCTSSNAAQVLRWAFGQADRVLFLPDQHLGRNIAHAHGIPPDEVLLWSVGERWGGHDPARLAAARIILWPGHCCVHQMFKLTHVTHFRREAPAARIVVHPECAFEVVRAADLYGSTEFIIRTVREAPPDSHWVVGTEINLVDRLAARHPDRRVEPLTRFGTRCGTMRRNQLHALRAVLEGLAAGSPPEAVAVPPETAASARLALERMLAITA